MFVGLSLLVYGINIKYNPTLHLHPNWNLELLDIRFLIRLALIGLSNSEAYKAYMKKVSFSSLTLYTASTKPPNY